MRVDNIETFPGKKPHKPEDQKRVSHRASPFPKGDYPDSLRLQLIVEWSPGPVQESHNDIMSLLLETDSKVSHKTLCPAKTKRCYKLQNPHPRTDVPKDSLIIIILK